MADIRHDDDNKDLNISSENANKEGNAPLNPEIKPRKVDRLEELKYSFSPDDELTELSDEMMFRAAHPTKVGIFSSGGLSNQIVNNIQEDYLEQLQFNNFKTTLETFHRFILTKKPLPGPVEESLPATEKNESDENIQIADKLETSTQATSESVQKATIHFEDEEFIFEPDTEGDIDIDVDKPGTQLQAPTEQAGTMELRSDSESISEPGEDITPEVDRNTTKPLSFLEKAQHIFHELKRKLGLIKPTPHVPPDKTTQQLEVEQIEGIDELSTQIEPAPKEVIQTDVTLDEPVSETTLIAATTQVDDGIQKDMSKLVKENDIIFIFTCLDDEDDVENTLLMSELAKKVNILSIVIASLPRYFGKVDNVYAMNKILQKLRLTAEIVILIPYFETFSFKLIPRLVQELLEVITKPGLINVDVADLKIVVKGGNVGIVTFGMGKHITRHKDALFEAIDSILLNVELGGVEKALLNVTGGKDIMLAEVEGLADQIKNRIKPGARFILGTSINPDLKDSIKIFLLLGVTPMQVMVNKYANE